MAMATIIIIMILISTISMITLLTSISIIIIMIILFHSIDSPPRYFSATLPPPKTKMHAASTQVIVMMTVMMMLMMMTMMMMMPHPHRWILSLHSLTTKSLAVTSTKQSFHKLQTLHHSMGRRSRTSEAKSKRRHPYISASSSRTVSSRWQGSWSSRCMGDNDDRGRWRQQWWNCSGRLQDMCQRQRSQHRQ